MIGVGVGALEEEEEEDDDEEFAGEVLKHRWEGEGWEIRVSKAGIYNSDNFSLSDKSHVAWKQELGLTRFANQDLPEALFGGNHLELLHKPSKIKISFSALEALRG